MNEFTDKTQLNARKRNNPTHERAKPPRLFPSKLTDEYYRGYIAGLNALHDGGRTWEGIAKDVGISISELDRHRKKLKLAPLPAFIHLANALNVSLVELLAMGQDE